MNSIKRDAAYYEQQGREYAASPSPKASPYAKRDNTSWQAKAFQRGYDEHVATVKARMAKLDQPVPMSSKDSALASHLKSLSVEVDKAVNAGDFNRADRLSLKMNVIEARLSMSRIESAREARRHVA